MPIYDITITIKKEAINKPIIIAGHQRLSTLSKYSYSTLNPADLFEVTPDILSFADEIVIRKVNELI